MGMFDRIKCDYPLPDGGPPGDPDKWDFQSKDLNCGMQTFRITKDGRLVNESEEGEHSFSLTFYTSTGKREDGTWQWWEYAVFFKDGTVERIEKRQSRFGDA